MKTTCQPSVQWGEELYVTLVHVQFGAPSKHCLHFGILVVALPKKAEAKPLPARTIKIS